ncbi:hypothetical protein [Patiriisocius sp. Uisw_017]|jgi:hypothetical protein|uniref:hypothetical protein n=1 Tax=Patiriisocius sp. Uisw_017 TaxID=3230968 RepID=UPI0039E7876C
MRIVSDNSVNIAKGDKQIVIRLPRGLITYKTKEAFDALKFMREQRDRISKEIMNLSPEEIVKYFEEKQGKPFVKPSA